MASGRAELRRLIDDLVKIPPELKRELRPAIKKGAQPMLEGMRSDTSWSTRIPAATRISSSLTGSQAGVSIVVDHRKAPHARPYENGGNDGDFRAPLFGDRERWYPHHARPFFAKNVREHKKDVEQAVAEAVTTTAAKHGF